jgi:hypothetical protein
MRCGFVDEHDLDPVALGEHIASCDTCARAVTTRTMARHTWSAAKVRDDRSGRLSRERRLMSGVGVGRALHRRSRGSVVLGALVVAAFCLALWLHSRRPSPSSTEMPLEPALPPPAAAATPVQEAPPASAPKGARVRVVDVRGGSASHEGTALAAGAMVEAGEPIDVAPRATVRLLWVLDVGSEDAEGDAGPLAEVLVVGPARVEVGAGSSPLLVVQRGQARVTGGQVTIAQAAGAAPAVSAGLEWGGHPSAPAKALPYADELDARMQLAEAEMQRGDRAAAEATLRALLSAREPSVRARAELMLAELLLARGEADEARRLLAPLAFGGDPKRAPDAAWLYARSFPRPGDRADAWARYLGTSPPAAMRALALIERASALFDAGDVAGAREIAAQLDEAQLAPVAADALRRLRSRLHDR